MRSVGTIRHVATCSVARPTICAPVTTAAVRCLSSATIATPATRSAQRLTHVVRSLCPTTPVVSSITSSSVSSVRSLSTTSMTPFPRWAFAEPKDMHKDMLATTQSAPIVRNYVGIIEDMSADKLVIETALWPRAALEFYTKFNMGTLTDADQHAHKEYYQAARGGEQGDYRQGLQAKIDNVIDCLTKFPESKRAVITIPNPSSPPDHRNDGEAKCLRELHFYLEGGALHCSGFMRAQAASIFPKNIHFIGTLMNTIAQRLRKPVGKYTHFVTTISADRQ